MGGLAGPINRLPSISRPRSLRLNIGRERDHVAKDSRMIGPTSVWLPLHVSLELNGVHVRELGTRLDVSV